MLDSWFGPVKTGQPRHTNGRFSEKHGSQAEISLNDPPASYGASGRDVLRFAAQRHGARWKTEQEREHVIDEYTAEFVLARHSATGGTYRRHPDDSAHRAWCQSATRSTEELAAVLLHEEDPEYHIAVLDHPNVTPAMVHYAAHHRDARVARHAIRHDRIPMHALVAVRDRYRRAAAHARAKHTAESWAPAQEHWVWLERRERETAELANERLMQG